VTAQRIDQDMAAAAARALPPVVYPELRTRYRQLQAMLHRAGLAPTYAFIAARAKGEGEDAGPDRDKLTQAYRGAARAIRLRVFGGDPWREPETMTAREVLTELGGMTPARYARASAEAAAFVGWLSRLADACVEPGQGGDDA
jgi:CRISPR/Cas system CMR-associated protein Cmr5 small subunit